MDELSRIFFHVDAADANAVHTPAGGEGLVELGNLVSLRQVRIEIVLSCEDRAVMNCATGRDRHPDRELDRLSIQHRQRSGVTEAGGTDLRVGRRAEGYGAAAEDFRAGLKSRVYFEPDDGVPHAGVIVVVN